MFQRTLLLAGLGLIASFVAFPVAPARAAEPAVAGIYDGRDDVTGNRVLTIFGKGLSAVKAVSLQIDDVTQVGGTVLLFKTRTMILFGLPTGLPKGSYIVRLYYGKALTQQDHPVVIGGTETWDVAGINAVLLSGKAGIGTNAPQGDLEVVGIDGVAFKGILGPGAIPAEGPGSRMMWFPGRAAFRAGYVDGAQWDDGSVGMYSFAAGDDTIALGAGAVAMGGFSTASSNWAIALGHTVTASGQYSFAAGIQATASGGAAVSIGTVTLASGDSSTATGEGTIAQARASFAAGAYNVAAGSMSARVDTDPVFVVGNGTTLARSNALTLLRNGNLTIAGTLTQASDARAKTDIAPLAGVLGRIGSVHGVSYRFKDGISAPEGRQIGLLAQEVREAFPELVAEDSEGKLSVAYGNFAAVLLEAVKEQQATIEAQRRDLDAMAKRLALLEARMEGKAER